jgi:predicted NBD/HSP70 family sugar kinase
VAAPESSSDAFDTVAGSEPKDPRKQNRKKQDSQREVLRVLLATGAQTAKELEHRMRLRRAPRDVKTIKQALHDMEHLHDPPLVRSADTAEPFHLPKSKDKSPGPAPKWFNISHHWGYVIGIDVGNLVIRGAVTDVDAWPLGGADAHVEVRSTTAKKVLDHVVSCIERSVAAARLRHPTFDVSQLRGIAIAVPAPITVDWNSVASSILPKWGRVKIRDEVRRRLPVDLRALDIAVFNEADARTIGEIRVGRARIYDDILLVKLSHGIGAGATHRGRLLMGSGSATELGHIRVDPRQVEGPPIDGLDLPIPTSSECACGQPNHLQSFASFDAMAARLGKTRKNGHDQEQLYREIAAGWRDDGPHGEILRQSCDFLAQALETACAILAPQAIVIGGRLADCGPDVALYIVQAMDLPIGLPPNVLLSTPQPTGQDAELQAWIGVRGAARMAIEAWLSIDRPPTAALPL